MRNLLTVLALTTSLSACCTTQTANPVQLECPPPLTLPALSHDQKQRVFDADPEAYGILLKRDRLQSARRETLCRIILSTGGVDGN